MQRRSFLPFLAASLLAPAAHAHFVWLEQTGSGPAAFFGEWSDNVRETQDGYLKSIGGPQAMDASGAALPVTVAHDRIAVAAPGSGDPRFIGYFKSEKGETLVRYHARLGRTDTTARLELELVPIAAGSNTFTVQFLDAPVPSAEVTLFTSEGWNRKFTADAAGRVTVLTPWPGQCVVEVAHVDKTSGEIDGRTYTSVRHVSTITFDVSKDS